jgi:hypothetical protein
LLPQAMLASDRTVVFDNSIASDADEKQRLRPVLESQFIENLLKIVPLPPVPVWTIEALKFAALSYAPNEISNQSGELIFSLSRFDSFEPMRIPIVDAAFQNAARQAIEMNERVKPIKVNMSWPPI